MSLSALLRFRGLMRYSSDLKGQGISLNLCGICFSRKGRREATIVRITDSIASRTPAADPSSPATTAGRLVEPREPPEPGCSIVTGSQMRSPSGYSNEGQWLAAVHSGVPGDVGGDAAGACLRRILGAGCHGNT